MMIKVKVTDKEAVEKALKDAQERASTRTVSYDDIVTMVSRIEKRLSIPKKYMVGVWVNIDVHAQHVPSSYNYRMVSTHFSIKYFPSGWYLTAVYRGDVCSPTRAVEVVLTDTAKQKVIEKLSCMNVWCY